MAYANEEFQLINSIAPPLSNGSYRVSVSQKVTIPLAFAAVDQTEAFEKSETFHVARNIFTLSSDEVFSVYPSNNEESDFSRILPHITLKNRTLPWEVNVASDINKHPVPWVALIVLTTEEATESEVKPSELWATTPAKTYFPPKYKFPKVFAQNENDVCRVIDMSKALFDEIIPPCEDLTYLTHVKKVNLRKCEDMVTALDGYFSVAIANRFPVSGVNGVHNVCHLVSMIGFADSQIPADCQNVRMVSLYRWDIFSKSEYIRSFAEIAEDLGRSSGALGCTGKNELQKQGYALKKHITRTGEMTYSLYRSALIPFRNEPVGALNGENKRTADGRLIYDETRGIFDVSYSSAFQLGRLITLSNRSISEKVTAWRRSVKMKRHKRAIDEQISFRNFDFAKMCLDLAGREE